MAGWVFRSIWVVIGAMIVSLSTRADEIPAGIAVPVVIVETDREINGETIDTILDSLGAPILRGVSLKQRLGIVSPAQEGVGKSLEDQFRVSQDNFFSGKHEAADKGFFDLIALAAANPSVLAAPSPLRKLVFKSHIYRAIIANGEGKEALVDEQLKAAAIGFPNLSPGSVDFPPWLRKRFATMKTPPITEQGAIEMDAPKGCELNFKGQIYSSGEVIEPVEAGDYGLTATCRNGTALPKRVMVSDSKVVFRPVVLRTGSLGFTDTDMVLKKNGDSSRDEMVADLVSIGLSGEWKRLVAVLESELEIEVLIIDTASKKVVRSTHIAPDNVEQTRGLVEDLAYGREEPAPAGVFGQTKPWYRDGLAWTLVGSGLALFGAGAFVAWKYGSPSRQEELAWPLLISGAGAVGTGAVLFFIPVDSGVAPSGARSGAAFGVVARVAF